MSQKRDMGHPTPGFEGSTNSKNDGNDPRALPDTPPWSDDEAVGRGWGTRNGQRQGVPKFSHEPA